MLGWLVFALVAARPAYVAGRRFRRWQDERTRLLPERRDVTVALLQPRGGRYSARWL